MATDLMNFGVMEPGRCLLLDAAGKNHRLFGWLGPSGSVSTERMVRGYGWDASLRCPAGVSLGDFRTVYEDGGAR